MYIATVDSTFKVHVNQNVTITIDGISHSHGHSDGLNKYTTFSNDTCVAVITEIRHRLVVTFPSEEHQLADKKFYLVVKAGPSGADGLVYFKQDNVKINLVVFFAVFFSCFFLLLSSVVIGWSIKHHIHSRQEVHNREVRDERLQSRPFGKFSFLLEYQSPSTSLLRHRKTTGSSRKAIRPMGLQSMSDYFSAVSTVMLQMPPTEKAKMSIVLGSTLTTLNPHQIDRLSKVKPKLSQELQTTNL